MTFDPQANDYQLPDMAYVPAGVFFPNYGGLGIYVKHKGHGQSGCRVVSSSGYNTHLICPDREILMVGNLQKLDGDAAFGDWDEFVPISFFHDMPGIAAQRGPQMYMVNAHQDKGREQVRHNTRLRAAPDSARRIMGDSGGFQLRIPGNFINPKAVMEHYNSNVDLGMVLDFPLRDPYHYDNLMRSAHLQRRNTNIMLSEKDNRVELINVVHGMHIKDRADFLEIIHHPEITSYAFSKAASTDGVVAFCYQLLVLSHMIEDRHPGHYKHLHILGITESKLIFAVARLVANGLLGDLKLTFDSSTHLHSSNAKSYMHQTHGMSGLRRVGIGDDLNVFNSNQKLPCDCPVCGAVGWMDALNLNGQSGISYFLSMHNIYATDAYFKSVLWYCTTKDHDDLEEVIKSQFKTNKNAQNELMVAINYLDTAKDFGLEKANADFGFFIDYINEKTGIETKTVIEESMFGGTAIMDDEEWEAYINDGRPHHEQDLERMKVFESRIQAMEAGIVNFDVQRAVAKKKGASGIARKFGVSGEGTVQEQARKDKKAKIKKEMKQSERKILVNTKVRKAASFKKAGVAVNKPKVVKSLTVRGKTKIMSKNKKRL